MDEIPLGLRFSCPKVREAKLALESKGWAVVPNVLTEDECNQCIKEYRIWLDQFGDEKPASFGCIIDEYNLGHKDTTWNVRLKAKPVFEQIWGTKKLLTSCDAVSIGYPPEEHPEIYEMEGVFANQLHLDQVPPRQGLHAYQGAVYLEEALEDDWNFIVIEGSHKYYTEFFQQRDVLPEREFLPMRPSDVDFYKAKDCEIQMVSPQKGDMVLWDSRTVHKGSPPFKGRTNPGRWRYVVFVCMVPAWWAKDSDLEKRKEAYKNMRSSVHWPAEGFKMFPKSKPTKFDIKQYSAIAKTDEVKRLCGALSYDFNDGQPNGPEWQPIWNTTS